MMAATQFQFTNSCAPIIPPCQVGQLKIDPCTCQGYFECQVGGFDFIQRVCGLGTAWNHQTGYCISAPEVVIGNEGTPLCNEDEPWLRCLMVPDHYSEETLGERCHGNAYIPYDDGGGGGGKGDRAAGIVGGVLGGLLILILVAIAVVWWKKRQNMQRSSGKMNSRPNIHHGAKSQQDEEEVYDVIDEKAVDMTSSNATYKNQKDGGDMEYDNLAFQQAVPNAYQQLSQHGRTNHKQLSPVSGQGQGLGDSTSSSLTVSGNYGNDLKINGSSSCRSISVGGKEVVVEDEHGYQVGYPSGEVPRQPSPLPLRHRQTNDGHDTDLGDGYTLSRYPPVNDYLELEKNDDM